MKFNDTDNKLHTSQHGILMAVVSIQGRRTELRGVCLGMEYNK